MMIVDTHTKESMQKSMCEVFQLNETELYYNLSVIDTTATDDYDYMEKLSKFVAEKAIKLPDEIFLFHLSRRLNDTDNDVEGHTLADLLTTQNEFSKFLYKHKLKFVYGEQHIEVFYKGKLVDWNKCWNGNPNYMQSRLGYYKGREDYCFNGFAFKDLIYKNNYARELSGVPEFVGQLIECLDCKNLGYDYMKNSTYYCYEYSIPLDFVVFDDNEKYSLHQKQRYLIRCVLQRLYEYQTNNINYMSDHDNPVLRLGDYFNVPSQYYVSREEITSDML